jgi:hypothetical protein
MPRLFPLLALLLALALGAPVFASSALAATSAQAATPAKKKPAIKIKRHVKRWTVPPGYRTPAQIERQDHDRIQRDRRAYYRAGGQRIYYWSDPNPRFYRGQWNGGSFGPCYTWTPIGAVWNCGK